MRLPWSTGDLRGRRFVVKADGVGSQINLSALVNLIDTSTADWDAGDGISQVIATNSGIVTLNSTNTQFTNVTTTETNNGMILGNFGLHVNGAAGIGREAGGLLAESDLSLVVDAAIERLVLATGSTAVRDVLANVEFRIADLSGTYLGHASSSIVWIDEDAAGFGWFVDFTPFADEEFDEDGAALADSRAAGQVDLLSVVMHELIHVLGIGHDDHDGGLMSPTIRPGQRLPFDFDELDSLFQDDPLLMLLD